MKVKLLADMNMFIILMAVGCCGGDLKEREKDVVVSWIIHWSCGLAPDGLCGKYLAAKLINHVFLCDMESRDSVV